MGLQRKYSIQEDAKYDSKSLLVDIIQKTLAMWEYSGRKYMHASDKERIFLLARILILVFLWFKATKFRLISRPHIYWFYQGHLGRETWLLSTRVTNVDPSSMITSSSSSKLTHGRKRLPTPPWNVRKSSMKTSQLRRKLGSTRFSGSSSSHDLSLGSFKENQ